MFFTISIDWFKILPEQEQILNSEIKLEWKLCHAIFKHDTFVRFSWSIKYELQKYKNFFFLSKFSDLPDACRAQGLVHNRLYDKPRIRSIVKLFHVIIFEGSFFMSPYLKVFSCHHVQKSFFMSPYLKEFFFMSPCSKVFFHVTIFKGIFFHVTIFKSVFHVNIFKGSFFMSSYSKGLFSCHHI